MKNFKKISLCMFLFACTFLCFSKNVRAIMSIENAINNLSENQKRTCNYSLEYPFKINNNENVKYAYSLYMNYILKKYGLNNNRDAFSLYEQQFAQKTSNGTLTTGVVSELSLKLTYAYLGEPAQYSVYTISGMQNNAETLTFSGKNNTVFKMERCPDLVAFSMNSSRGLFATNYNSAISSSFVNLPMEADNIDATFISALKNDYVLYNTGQDFALVFVSDDYKIITGGIAYVNYSYNPSFNETKPERNIDPIVDKYLKIDGISEILNQINKNIDDSFETGSISKDSYQIDDSALNKALNNITDYDSISSELAVLEKFNSVTVSKYTGLRNILNAFLSESAAGYKASEWFSKYMPDSKSQYADALEILLSILNSDEIKSKREQLKNLDDVSKEFNHCMQYKLTIENCMSECQKYYKWNACKDESNISSCINAYPNNVCDNKTGEDVSNDMNKSQKDIKEDIKDIVEKKLIQYYENKGIEIGDDKDFCDILIGKDNKNGLYPYIKIVLNVTRIGGTVLVVILTGLDVMKVISSFKDDENKKFWNHLKIRLICLVVLILVPTIINFLVKLVIESACKVEI